MNKFFLLANLVMVLVLSQVSCGESVTQPSIQVRPVKHYEEQARAIAQEWFADSFLFSVYVQPRAKVRTDSAPISDLLSFQFVSPSNTSDTLYVTFSFDESTEITKLPLAASPSEFTPIQATDWKLDSTDAWHITLAHLRANDQKSKYPFSNASMHLQRWNPPHSGRVLWYVIYRTIGPSVILWIDPVSGEIVQER